MSISPGLLASTSRFALPLTRLGAGASVRQQPARWVRAASGSASSGAASSPSSGAGGASVQNAEEQIRLMERNMRYLPPGMEIARDTYIMEPIVDPAFNLSWLISKSGRKYASDRAKRYLGTLRHLWELQTKGTIVPWKGPTRFSRFIHFFTQLSPSEAMRNVMPELAKTYSTYYSAQASGDERTINALSIGPARDRAQKVASSVNATRNGSSWSLVRNLRDPFVVSVRYAAVDQRGKVLLAQAVVRFDTEQALTIAAKGNKPQSKKQQRVLEYIVFERKVVPGAAWLIKDAIDVTIPECAKK